MWTLGQSYDRCLIHDHLSIVARLAPICYTVWEPIDWYGKYVLSISSNVVLCVSVPITTREMFSLIFFTSFQHRWTMHNCPLFLSPFLFWDVEDSYGRSVPQPHKMHVHQKKKICKAKILVVFQKIPFTNGYEQFWKVGIERQFWW